MAQDNARARAGDRTEPMVGLTILVPIAIKDWLSQVALDESKPGKRVSVGEKVRAILEEKYAECSNMNA